MQKDGIDFIVNWLTNYAEKAKMNGFVIGISGGIDSAVTSTLCAMTKLNVCLVALPIRQHKTEFDRANEHINWLKNKFQNVTSSTIDLSETLSILENQLPETARANHLVMANTRSRLRMTTLYALAQDSNVLVAGTGNKIEDFGVGFYTKYGDGGVDISPIADLTKSEVFQLAQFLHIVPSIQDAKPTDGLWEDGRSDEDQIGASYPELEWAMDFQGDETKLTDRKKEVLAIYKRLNAQNQHKMQPIPVCTIPQFLRG